MIVWSVPTLRVLLSSICTTSHALLHFAETSAALQVHVGHVMIEKRKPAVLDSAFQVNTRHKRSDVWPGKILGG